MQDCDFLKFNSLADHLRDVSFLTNQPGASERLRIFNADLDKPDSFDAAIEGCIGVFHVAHPIDLEGKESEEEKTKKAINGTLGILQACLKAKTVKRVIYTSSASTAMPDDNAGIDIVDESTWTNTASLRGKNSFGVVYAITKTLTEKTCLEFGEKHGLDIVTVLPTWIHGPFISPNVPGSVRASMVMIFGTFLKKIAENAFRLFLHCNSKLKYFAMANCDIKLFLHSRHCHKYDRIWWFATSCM